MIEDLELLFRQGSMQLDLTRGSYNIIIKYFDVNMTYDDAVKSCKWNLLLNNLADLSLLDFIAL